MDEVKKMTVLDCIARIEGAITSLHDTYEMIDTNALENYTDDEDSAQSLIGNACSYLECAVRILADRFEVTS